MVSPVLDAFVSTVWPETVRDVAEALANVDCPVAKSVDV